MQRKRWFSWVVGVLFALGPGAAVSAAMRPGSFADAPTAGSAAATRHAGGEEKARVRVVGPGKPGAGKTDIDRLEVERPDLPERP